MISQKELTIYELLEELKNLKKEYYKLATILAKRIEPLKGLSYDDVNSTIKGRGGVKDTMTNNLAKAEEYQTKLDAIKDSYNSYYNVLMEKIEIMQGNCSEAEMIVFCRDELHWKWSDIAKMVNYTDRHCRRIYSKIKKMSYNVPKT